MYRRTSNIDMGAEVHIAAWVCLLSADQLSKNGLVLLAEIFVILR